MAGNANSGRLGSVAKVDYEELPEFTVKCPTDISKGAKAHWKNYVEQLKEILQDKDAQALKRLCVLQDLWAKAAATVEKKGFTVEELTDRGNVVTRERIESRLMKQYSTSIKDLETRFGLTPKAGEGIAALKRKKKRESVRDQY